MNNLIIKKEISAEKSRRMRNENVKKEKRRGRGRRKKNMIGKKKLNKVIQMQ